MKMMRKLFLLTAGMLMVFAILGGCSSNTDTGRQSAAAADASENTVFGQVTAVNGNEITVALGNQQRPQMNHGGNNGDGESSRQDAIPSGGDGMPSGRPSDLPSGQPPEMPSGEMPSGELPQGGLQTTGEEKTVTVSESTVITIRSFKESSEGSLSDIAVGNIVSITMDGDTVKEIAVMRMDRGGAPSQNEESGQSASPSASA